MYYITDLSRLQSDAFVGINSEIVNQNIYQMIYWFTFPCIMVCSMAKGYLEIPSNFKYPTSLHSLKFTLQSAIMGLTLGLLSQIFNNGFIFMQKGLIADLLRIESLILMLLCIFLIICRRKWSAVLLSFFLIVDIVRIIFAA